ncbi:MAG: hypothetical protein COU98_01610 [Candidatus Staskawiczbacteria bacterium CG10_big_fil_rev_8_21_14_0_10_38_10]|uniref:Septum formation initiator n=1 Tax=Candidatus Staskawiczbacteria bacterium CG10_big_fil_rev_8_21_14_0_10_38_10 TaxID=1974891 RepID=A0A2H9T191_9BACT|nr:MAG: hypothetical protein COU98_01610 [Candidatus Staskawiczbacteria bacterium CG10_big_fil_rev_8_21_14_0_10_38_10]
MITKYSKKRKEGVWKNIAASALLGIFSLGIIGFLIYENAKMNYRRNKLLAQINSLEKELQEAQERNALLKEGILKSGQEEYIEKIAREELNLQKEGEKAVAFVLPEEKQEEKKKENIWNPKTWWEWIKEKLRD